LSGPRAFRLVVMTVVAVVVRRSSQRSSFATWSGGLVVRARRSRLGRGQCGLVVGAWQSRSRRGLVVRARRSRSGRGRRGLVVDMVGSLNGSGARLVARCGRATCCIEKLILICFNDRGVVRAERHQVVAMHAIVKATVHVYTSQSPCMSELRES